jgi:hypothetical protein
MLVKVLSFSRSNKPAVLASVRLEIALEDGDSIVIDDARVLRNKHAQLWLAMPSYSVPEWRALLRLPASGHSLDKAQA